MSLNLTLLITLIVLVIPFVIYFQSSNRKGRKAYVKGLVIYLVVASPAVYAVIDDRIMQYEDANIGLGLSFFLTWFLTACLLIASLVVFLKSRTNKIR